MESLEMLFALSLFAVPAATWLAASRVPRLSRLQALALTGFAGALMGLAIPLGWVALGAEAGDMLVAWQWVIASGLLGCGIGLVMRLGELLIGRGDRS